MFPWTVHDHKVCLRWERSLKYVAERIGTDHKEGGVKDEVETGDQHS